MKVGDLVKYRGWSKTPNSSIPIGIVVAARGDQLYHKRIRVMWMGEKIPIQADVLSVGSKSKRVTTWVHPKHFKVINDS